MSKLESSTKHVIYLNIIVAIFETSQGGNQDMEGQARYLPAFRLTISWWSQLWTFSRTCVHATLCTTSRTSSALGSCMDRLPTEPWWKRCLVGCTSSRCICGTRRLPPRMATLSNSNGEASSKLKFSSSAHVNNKYQNIENCLRNKIRCSSAKVKWTMRFLQDYKFIINNPLRIRCCGVNFLL